VLLRLALVHVGVAVGAQVRHEAVVCLDAHALAMSALIRVG
jgi:hypothetical protein